MDCIATTEWQARHRDTRRVEREKYEMRLVALECAESEAHPSPQKRDAAAVAQLLQSFTISPTHAPYTSADAPFSAALASELHEALLAQFAERVDPELAALRRVSEPALPQPEILVQVPSSGIEPQQVDIVTRYVEGPMRRVSATFAQLSAAERELLVSTVGGDSAATL